MAKNLSWEELLSSFTTSQHTCSVRLLDSIFISNEHKQWYYTTKNGTVAKKKKNKTKNEDITARFNRFAMSNPNNKHGYVGVVVGSSGIRKYLDYEGLNTYLESASKENGSFLQVYLRPQDGLDRIVVANYSTVNSKGNIEFAVKAQDQSAQVDVVSLPNSEFLCNQASIFTNEIKKCVEATHPDIIVKSMAVEYVVDDNGHIWLSCVDSLSLTSVSNGEDDIATPASASESVLPGLTPRTASSQSSQRRRGGAEGFSASSPDRLIRREGGVYRCALGPDDLPGLRAWVLAGISDRTAPSNAWVIDMVQYFARTPPDKKLAGVRQSRFEMRRSVPSLLATFLNKCEPLLTGDMDVGSEKEFTDKWREAYAIAVAADSAKHTSGEVPVCGNCHAICAKLESLIEADFKVTAGLESLDKAEENSRRPHSESNMQREHPEETNKDAAASSASEINRVRSSPALPSGQPESNSTSSVGGQKNKSGGTTGKSLKGGKKSASSNAKPAGKSVTKPKKKEDIGPSVEMLAKFAAERDRQRQLMGDEEPTNATTSASTSVTSKKSTKKKQNKSTADDEKRLEELERMAAMSSLQSNMTSANGSPFAFQQFGSHGEGGTKKKALTGVEEQFMLRQASLGTISQFAALSYDEDEGPPLTSSKFDQEAINRLKGNIAEKDNKIEQLQLTIRELEKDLEKSQRKYQDVNKRFIDFRAQVFDERDQLKIEHETEILMLKEAHATHMAEFAKQERATIGNTEDSDAPRPPNAATASSDSRGTKALLDQMEILRTENKNLSEKIISDRKMMQTEFSVKLLTSEKAHNEMVQRLKNTIGILEDKNLKLNDEVEGLATKCTSLTEHNSQLEQARVEALNGQQRLRADLKSMQSAVATSYKLESSQNIGIGVDADTAIKLSEARAEARVRQLSNQVEFLKSQLAAELSSVEEMKSVLEAAKEKAEHMKNDFRNRMAEAERQRVADVEAAEQRVEQRYELRMNELSTLQAKFAAIQGQMQEAFQDSEAAKQREELAKNSAAKAQAHATMMRTEIEQLRKQISDLQEQNDGNTGTDNAVSKHSQESMMRRLDNERQYLKSQLSSEITLKNELQNTLTHCQKQLSDIQRQWTEDVEVLKEAKRQSEAEAVQIEQRLNQRVTVLKSESERAKSQLEDMKEGFVKMREQLRSEQTSLENAKAVIKRLNEELESTREEIAALKEEEQRNTKMYRDQLDAVTTSMREMEESKSETIKGLREELSRQFLETSTVQKQSIVLKREIQEEKHGFSRKVEAIRLYSSLVRWHNNNLGHYFRLWTKNASLVYAASQFRKKMKEVLKRKDEEHSKDKDYIIHVTQTDCEIKFREELEETKNAAKKEVADTVEHYEQLIEEERVRHEEHERQALADKEIEWQESMEELQHAHKKDMNDLVEQHQQQVQELKTKFKDEMSRQTGMLQDQAYREKLDVIDSTTRDLTAKFEQEKTELEDNHFDKIQSIEQRHVAEMNSLRESLESKKNEEIKLLHIDFSKKEADIRRELALEMSRLEARLEDDKKQAIADCEAETERLLSEARQDAHIASEERIRLMRELWEEELAEKMKAKDQEAEAKACARVDEANLQASELKAKAVKLETSKWQQVLKEAEKRYALEVQQARVKGFAECEQKLRNEMQVATDDNARKILVAEDRNREAMDSLRREYMEKIDKLKDEHDLDTKKVIKETEERVKKEIDDGMQLKIAGIVAEAQEEVRVHWQEKLSREEARLERMKADMSRMTHSQAEDRRHLQTQIDTLEIRLQQKEISCNEIVQKLEQEIQRGKDQFLANQKKLRKELTDDFEEEKEEILTKARAEWEEETRRRIAHERDQVNQQLDVQMSEMQEENDRLISNLESAMSDLRKEKVALSDELESATTKLENTEDSLYDSQQAFTKLQKTHSLMLWKTATRAVNMQQLFRKELTKQTKDAESTLAHAQAESKEKLQDLIMIGFKLSALIIDSEKTRQMLNSTLSSYKSDELIEKRTAIKLLEKEVSRMAEEKDMMEEQRDAIEDETQELEEQVKDMEDQIREHNRASSVMQNGRINVAHARKKKRFDTELERMLDLIEQKRSQIADMDERIGRLVITKDEKESELVDLEKSLVVILIEQQRLVLNQVESSKSIEEKAKMLIKMSMLPWPPPEAPTHSDVEMVLGIKKES